MNKRATRATAVTSEKSDAGIQGKGGRLTPATTRIVIFGENISRSTKHLNGGTTNPFCVVRILTIVYMPYYLTLGQEPKKQWGTDKFILWFNGTRVAQKQVSGERHGSSRQTSKTEMGATPTAGHAVTLCRHWDFKPYLSMPNTL